MADYDSRLLLLSEEEFNALNARSEPNQKQAIIDDDPDVVDTLDVNEDGFVVVPAETRRLFFDANPNSYKTSATRRLLNPGDPFDSTNINVQNKKMNVKVFKESEDDEYITFNVKIENTDSNCLVLDNIVQISGIDYSLVNEQNISENEKILNTAPNSTISIITNNTISENFIKKIIPNYESIQSQLNAPFTVEVPDFLQQVDAKSIVLCPPGTGYSPSNSSNEETVPTAISGKLLPIQAQVIQEAHRWLGFYEKDTGNNNPVVRLIKNGQYTQQVADTSLVEFMKKETGWSAGQSWCAGFAFSIVKKACRNIGDPFATTHIGGGKLSLGTLAAAGYAAKKGILVNAFVPGCVALFQRTSEKGHAMIVIDVRKIQNGGQNVYDIVMIDGNTSGESGAPRELNDCSKKSGSHTAGGKIAKKVGNTYYIGKFKFLGCVVPENVQASVPNSNYDIFISNTINYKNPA